MDELKPCPTCGSPAEANVSFPKLVACKDPECVRYNWINIEIWNKQPLADRLAARVAEMEAENDRACAMIAKMHAAAVGSVRGPIVGVVEDVANIAAENDRLKDELNQCRAGAYNGQLETKELRSELAAEKEENRKLRMTIGVMEMKEKVRGL